jgi:tetratricopeptide (TPR) repeat protein
LEGEHDARVPKDYLTQNLIGQFHFMIGSTFETRDWPRASRSFDAAQRAAPDNDVLFYNLGLIYRRNGLLEEALAAFSRSQEINPRHIASKSRVRAADRLAELQGELERLRPIEEALSRQAGIPPGSVAYHLQMAQLLDERDEPSAARGHRLRALVRKAEVPGDFR